MPQQRNKNQVQYAYARLGTLTCKAASGPDGMHTLTGVASTPVADRMGDIVESTGARFQNPMPLLWQHDSRAPVGDVSFGKPTKDGIRFTARIFSIDEPGRLKDRLDEAWQSVKIGLVKAVSIGFRVLEHATMENGGWRILEWEDLELSLVTIPANADATIDAIRSIDTRDRAASGSLRSTTAPRPAFTATVSRNPQPGVRRTDMPRKSLSEQIVDWQATKAARVEKMNDMTSDDSGETMSAEEQKEFDAITAEIGTIDAQIARLKTAERLSASTVRPVEPSVETREAPEAFSTPAQVRPPKPAPGIRFARLARCLAISHRDHYPLEVVARQLFENRDPEMVGLVKAAVAAISSATNPALIGNEGGFADFVDFLRPMTIVGKFGTGGIPSLRRIPFRVPLITQATGGTASWVGEGKPKPVTTLTTSRTEMDPLKITALAVATMEQVRDSSPEAETVIRDDLGAAITYGIDLAFIDGTNAGSAGVKPAGISNGTTAITSEGQDIDAIYDDLRAALGAYVTADNPLTAGVWVMSGGNALSLSLVRNPLGQTEFPGVNVNGGILLGLPVITSSAAGTSVTLINATDVWLGDMGGVNVSISTEASLEMLDNPTNASIGADPVETTVVSMFQTNSVAFLLERTINWARRRASAVKRIDGVTWGTGAT